MTNIATIGSGMDTTPHRDYWLRQFPGEIPVLHLESDRRRTRLKTYRDERIHGKLGRHTCERLDALSRERDVTLFMTLLSIVNTLFYRYTGQTDIVLGSSTAGSDLLPLRTCFDKEDSFTGLLSKVKEIVVDGFDHQPYPFDLLVKDLKMDNRQVPFFDILVLLEHPRANPVRIDTNSGQYDLIILFTPMEDGTMDLSLQYNADLFSRQRMERMAGHFSMLTGSIVENPVLRLWQYELLTPPEVETLNGFNHNRIDLPPGKTVPVMLAEQAALHGEKIAFQCGAQKRSYSEWNLRANALAHILIARPVPTGSLVLILLSRSIEMAESILAVWKIGCAYIPVSPTDPAQRILDIARDAGVRLLISDTSSMAAYAGTSLESDVPLLLLDRLDLTGCRSDDPDIVAAPDDLAYVIYTSGSTGKPKGVMIEHAGMLNHMLAKITTLQIGEGSIVAQTASQCFDISIWQFFAAPAAGGRTVIYGKEDINDPQLLISSCGEDGVTIIEVVPSYLRVLLEIVEQLENGIPPPGLRMLHYLVVTGEALEADLLSRWFSLLPDIPVVNAYGPTEASDDITQNCLYKAPDSEEISIGKALPNCALYILDEHNGRCPIGIRGEICVSGIGVGRGYLNDPERTNRAFLYDPFVKDRNVRMYKTGDTGLYLADGGILFYGRKDYQVKIRGHRIELGEIEQALMSIPGVRQAVVLERKERTNDLSLAAFVCLDQRGTIKKGELIAALQKLLPPYMMPRNLTLVPRIPLTPNGKTDRKMLLTRLDAGR